MCTDDLDTICQNKQLSDLAEKYIFSCRETVDSKKNGRFPNLAGFCRFFGFSGEILEKIKSDYPDSYSTLCMIFEDEALNSELSPTLLSVYLKKRMRYGDAVEEKVGAKEVRYCFEHDVFADGE